MIVVWRVTEQCNLSCGFCAYDRRLPFARRTADFGEIERLGAVLADWKRVYGKEILISWLGGEPLLLRPLQETTRRFTKEFGLRVSTTTNGTTLHRPDVREHLLDAYHELTVSIDALGATHDELRGMPGLFSRLRIGINDLVREKEMRGVGLKLRANIVLMRRTFAGFPDLCRELADWGVREITFNALGGRDRPEFFPENRLLTSQTDQLPFIVRELRKELNAKNVTLLGSTEYLQRLSSSARDIPMPVADCQPGETFLFIDERGRVSPCSFTSEEYGLSTSQFDTAGALELLPRRFRELRSEKCSVSCQDCMSTHVFTKFSTAYGNRGSATRITAAPNL